MDNTPKLPTGLKPILPIPRNESGGGIALTRQTPQGIIKDSAVMWDGTPKDVMRIFLGKRIKISGLYQEDKTGKPSLFFVDNIDSIDDPTQESAITGLSTL